MSPTQCWAHACGQPSRWRRRSAISIPKRSSSRSISAPSRVFVSATEKLQWGSPVQAIELPRTGLISSGDLHPEALVEPIDQRAEPGLRRGDREVAVGLARAGDRVAPYRVDLER